MSILLQEETVRIIWGSVWVAKATWKEFWVFDYKTEMWFKQNIFINQPSDELKDSLSDLDTNMWKEVIIKTFVEVKK